MWEGSVGRALARAGMAHRAKALELLSQIDLHPGQEFLLSAVDEHGPCAIGELADHLGVEQPTVTKMVQRLAPTGYVERRPDPDDGRRSLVSLSESGTETLAAARARWRELDELMSADLTDGERELLLSLLVRVRSSLCVD